MYFDQDVYSLKPMKDFVRMTGHVWHQNRNKFNCEVEPQLCLCEHVALKL